MNWFGAKNKHTDERIVSTQNKLYKETYNVIVLICIVSIIVKYIMYETELRNIAIELIILLGSAAYYGFRSIQLGLYSDKVEVHDQGSKKLTMSVKTVVWSGILGIAIAAFFGIRSAVVYGEGFAQSTWYFIIVFAAALMIYVPFWVIFLGGGHAVANYWSRRNSQNDLNE